MSPVLRRWAKITLGPRVQFCIHFHLTALWLVHDVTTHIKFGPRIQFLKTCPTDYAPIYRKKSVYVRRPMFPVEKRAQ